MIVWICLINKDLEKKPRQPQPLISSNMRYFVIIISSLAIGFAAGAYLQATSKEDIVTPSAVEVNRELTGWQLLQMAIIKTESEYNPLAIGKNNDVGILQITPIYVTEVNRLLDTAMYVHLDAFDVTKSLEMFNIMQSRRNPEHDIEQAILLQNPNGDAIGYTGKVLTNFRRLSAMEAVRQQVINY